MLTLAVTSFSTVTVNGISNVTFRFFLYNLIMTGQKMKFNQAEAKAPDNKRNSFIYKKTILCNTLFKKKITFDSPSKRYKVFGKSLCNFTPRKTYQSRKHKFKKLFTSILNSEVFKTGNVSEKYSCPCFFLSLRLPTTLGMSGVRYTEAPNSVHLYLQSSDYQRKKEASQMGQVDIL